MASPSPFLFVGDRIQYWGQSRDPVLNIQEQKEPRGRTALYVNHRRAVTK